MNYIEYFNSFKYKAGENDCWSFIQDIYEKEHNIILPDCPVFDDIHDRGGFLKANVKYKTIDKPKKGALIYSSNNKIEHVGYALNDKQYIHKTFSQVAVSAIPNNCYIYEVFNND